MNDEGIWQGSSTDVTSKAEQPTSTTMQPRLIRKVCFGRRVRSERCETSGKGRTGWTDDGGGRLTGVRRLFRLNWFLQTSLVHRWRKASIALVRS